MNVFKHLLGWLKKKLWKLFIAGIITILPLGATILILVWLFSAIDNILQPVITAIWGHTITGAGFGLLIAVIFLTGVIVSNVVGKSIVRSIEAVLHSIPIVSFLYRGIKEVIKSISFKKTSSFSQVVLVEFPRKGIMAIGFVTNELYVDTGKKMYNVFIPATPNPTTGTLQIIGEDEIIKTNISIEDAIKMVVSAGKVYPADMIPPMHVGSTLTDIQDKR